MISFIAGLILGVGIGMFIVVILTVSEGDD